MAARSRQPHNNAALRALVQLLHPKLDADAIVDELMRGHASQRAIAQMSVAELSTLLPERTAELIHLIPGIARSTLRNNFPAHPKISCLAEACRFLHGRYLGLSYEHCHLLLLRKNRIVVHEQMIQSGTINSLPFYTRNIMEVVLATDADAIVVSHNHPGGTTAPSQSDISSTVALIEALAPLSIPLLDHVIITDSAATSIREGNFIPDSLWNNQPNACPQLLKDWLNPPVKRKK